MKEFVNEIGHSIAGLVYFAVVTMIALVSSNASARNFDLATESVVMAKAGGQSVLCGH